MLVQRSRARCERDQCDAAVCQGRDFCRHTCFRLWSQNMVALGAPTCARVGCDNCRYPMDQASHNNPQGNFFTYCGKTCKNAVEAAKK